MSYSVKTIPTFLKQSKRLSKKNPSLKNDLTNLITSLEENPLQGSGLGNNCFKVRLAIKSKNKGKSGGGRVITYLINKKNEVYLLSILR